MNGLQEKIFIDRYALKDVEGANVQVGDTVIAVTHVDNDKQTKAVGIVTSVDHANKTAGVVLNNNGQPNEDGEEVAIPFGKLSIAREWMPEQMWARVAEAVAAAETTEELRAEWERKFYSALADWKLVPGGRIMAGAGTGDELTLFNCYVIPSPKDSRDGITETLSTMVEIMARGGGVGINLSSLRPKRAVVRGVNGTSSGAVSWGGIYSYATGLVEQGGSRRGALMLMLNDWHPDIAEFITVKQQAGRITNANLSVAVSDAFMRAVQTDGKWPLRFPDTAHPQYDEEWNGNLAEWERKGYPVIVHETVNARDLWESIIESAWASAEPGVVFMERYNAVSNSWYFNPIIATNPCAEQGLPAWGVCNLTSINLAKFVTGSEVDWAALADVVRTGVRFLDNVIDVTPYHFEENRVNQQNERRIGLGTMGLADMLIQLGIRYGSEESLEFIDRLYEFIALEAYTESVRLAEEKGAFPAWDRDKFLYNTDAGSPTFAGKIMDVVKRDFPTVYKRYNTTGIRNVTLLTQAPTGSTGTMVDTSTGIEPYFAFEYYREGRLGVDKQHVKIAQDWLAKHTGEVLPDYFVTAMELSAHDHVKVQAAIQTWVDSSISKTANAPSTYTAEDTRALYESAYALGCKGVTIYRDGSRDTQVLRTKESVESADKPAFYKRPKVLNGKTIKTQTPFGKAYVTINENDNGDIEEVFVKLGKTGADIGVIADGLAIALTGLLSPRLSSLTPSEKLAWITKKFRRMSGATSIGFGEHRVDSLPDAIAQVFEVYAEGLTHSVEATPTPAAADICPECGAASLVAEEGCANCKVCGYSRCS